MWWLWAWSHAAAVSGAVATGPGIRAGDPQLGPSHVARAEAPPYPTGDARGGEHSPTRTGTESAASPAAPRALLEDDDVLRVLEAKEPVFLRCYRIAQKHDILLGAAQVTLHVEVGPTGTVDTASALGTTPALGDCLVAVARRLTFPAPARPVEANLKLFFAP